MNKPFSQAPIRWEAGGSFMKQLTPKIEKLGKGAGFKIPCPQYVAWDLDTTGRRLIDEICQVIGDYLD